MEQKTLLVTRKGHPDARVLINEADFDPDTETRWEPEAEPADAPAEAKADKPAKSKRAA